MKKSEFQSEWRKDGKNGPDREIHAKSQRLALRRLYIVLDLIVGRQSIPARSLPVNKR